MIWAHQVPELPPGGYARYESYHRESETLLKHFRNLAPPSLGARLVALLESDRGRWVDEKVRSFLTANNQFHDFTVHKELEAELKSKGEGLNSDIGELMEALREDIMAHTAARIESLGADRTLTAVHHPARHRFFSRMRHRLLYTN